MNQMLWWTIGLNVVGNDDDDEQDGGGDGNDDGLGQVSMKGESVEEKVFEHAGMKQRRTIVGQWIYVVTEKIHIKNQFKDQSLIVI